MFLNAKSSDTCENFSISLKYDDSTPPVPSTDRGLMQKTNWWLFLEPKPGAEAKDFYCTLVLNDWIISQSSSPTLLYMGIAKSSACDMPSESTGLDSRMLKYVKYCLTQSEEYKKQIIAPVYIMLSYNNQKEYYSVTPEFEELTW